jgi:hypothetical protein
MWFAHNNKANTCKHKQKVSVTVQLPAGPLDAVVRLLTRFFFVTYARARSPGGGKNQSLSTAGDTERATEFGSHLLTLYTNNTPACAWLLNSMANPASWPWHHVLFEAAPAICEAAAALLKVAFSAVIPLELNSFSLDKRESKSVLFSRELGRETRVDPRGFAVGLLDVFHSEYINKLREVPNDQVTINRQCKNASYVWRLLAHVTSLDPRVAAYFRGICF